MQNLKALLVLSVVFFTPYLWSQQSPYSVSYLKTIQQKFYSEDGSLSLKKINTYRNLINSKKHELVGVEGKDLTANSILAKKYEGSTEKKKVKKINEHEYAIAFQLIERKLNQLEVTLNIKYQQALINEILELEGAMRKEGLGAPLKKLVSEVSSLTSSWKVSKSFNAKLESTNLYDGFSGRYMSQDRISQLYKEGYDLSLVNPLDSSFWQNPKRGRRKTMKEIALGASMSLYDNKAVEFPQDGVTLYFDEVKRSATKPKINVYHEVAGKKVKYKLKLGAELHSDPTAAALMMSLGFATDITQVKKNIKLILKDSSYEEFKLQWESYYRRDSYRLYYPIESYISEKGLTAEGDEYLVFKEGLLEAKPKGIERLGPWGFGELGHDSYREVRASLLVQMWINNVDIKFENNKVLLKKINGDYKIFHINSDPGKSFGAVLIQEKPDAFDTKIVKDVKSKEVVLKYISTLNKPIKNKSTYSDLRWGTRLIASLTRKQIAEAVNNGRWPHACVERFYVERLISRRNDLVESFDLNHEIELIPVNDTLLSQSFDEVCKGQDEALGESTTNFDSSLSVYAGPPLKTTRDVILRALRGVTNTINSARINVEDVAVTDRGYIRVVAAPDRLVELNPNPKSSDDLYIVTDSIELGFGLGLNTILYGDSTYSKKYTLSYTARTLKEAETRNMYIADIFLPFHLSKKKLPKKYVLTVDHYFNTAAGIRSAPLSLVSATVEAQLSKKLIYRTTIDKSQPEQYILYAQKTDFLEASLDAFIRVIFLKLSLYENLNQWSGTIDGKGGFIKAQELDENPGLWEKLHGLTEEGDASELRPYLDDFYLWSDFKNSIKEINLIFWSQKKQKRLDQLTIGTEEGEKSQLQYLSSIKSKYAIVVEPEARRKVVQVYTSSDNQKMDYEIKLQLFKNDPVTKDKELQGSYLELINAIGDPQDKKIIPFTPSLGYARNGLWGHTLTNVNITYYPKAVKKMLETTEVDVWKAVSEVTGFTNTELNEKKYYYLKQREINSSADNKILKVAYRFIKYIDKYKESDSKADKIKYLAKALRRSLRHQNGFYNPFVLKLINKIVGYENYYAEAEIVSPPFRPEVFFEGQGLSGVYGHKQESQRMYIDLSTLTPTEHFNFLTNLSFELETIGK